MKKLFILVITLIASITFVGCSGDGILDIQTMSSKESLVSLSYLSAGFLDLSTSSDTTQLNFKLLSEEETPEVEGDLDNINMYFDLLKGFIDKGSTDFGNVVVDVSDRVEYTNKITISVEQVDYLLYFNVDSTIGEIQGVFVIGDVEYQIVATNHLDDSDDFEHEFDDDDDDDDDYDNEDEDDDDDFDDHQNQVTTEVIPTEPETTVAQTTEEQTTEALVPTTDSEAGATKTSFRVYDAQDELDTEEDEVSNESEYKMELLATNGDDYIRISYKVETDNEESKTKFEIEKNISGLEEELEVTLKTEDDEYKVEIEKGENSYEFKQEIEDGETVYELEYSVNGVEGEIKIIVTEDIDGNPVYTYEIKEGNKIKEVEKNRPDSKGFDDDEDDEEDDLEEQLSLQIV